jgi:AraC-like DNA-binding protein
MTDKEAETPENSRVDESFRLRQAAKMSVRALNKSRLAVTELKYDALNYGMTDPMFQEDAFLVGVQLRPLVFHELWYDGGKAVPVPHIRPGHTLFYDLRSLQMVRVTEPFHSLQFYLSRAFLNELADDLEAPRIEELQVKPGVPALDSVILRMAHAIQPALGMPIEVNELYSSHMMFAFALYVTSIYGGLKTPRQFAGGLSRWQERIAKELIEAHIEGSISVQELAATCGLSTSRFAHAFRSTTGIPPHRWLLARRIARAKTMLGHSRERLASIALACGFADQAHFNRVFRAATGATPRDWRKAQK